MDRTTPVAHKKNIDLYIRTYYSLLRSSEPIRVRSLEETHINMDASLHLNAKEDTLDTSAFVYAALRLPQTLPDTSLIVMGQMDGVFERAGHRLSEWEPVRARARRRKFYFDKKSGTLAAYIASVSDIDDLIPCLTAFQIEWNKLHQRLVSGGLHQWLQNTTTQLDTLDETAVNALLETVRQVLGLTEDDMDRFHQIWPGKQLFQYLQLASKKRLDLSLTTLGSGLSDYRRSVQAWWRGIEQQNEHHCQGKNQRVESSEKSSGEKLYPASLPLLAERPVYFVSSNIHSLANLTTGMAWQMQDELTRYIVGNNPEGLRYEYETLMQNEGKDVGGLANLLYYIARFYLQQHPEPQKIRQAWLDAEQKSGITRIQDPSCLDVEAQIFEINQIDPTRLDPRMRQFSKKEISALRQSDALIFNIDYPLGMAAYHIFSQFSTAVGRILGVYVIGKAASLSGRVGDVMIPNVVYDEHSYNSYLFRNCFTAGDVAPYLRYGSVFDNQKAVTVRGTFLQNSEFMHVFYEEGYTDIEMEAGPYLSGIYEDIYPRRYPTNEIVNLFINAPYDIGFIHYASDTPISKRTNLLSKSMSYFGVDGTYATMIAVYRRILQQEIARYHDK
ncbi:MAG: hypothetical protein AAF639_23160 [Chloroflexota bacterium]